MAWTPHILANFKMYKEWHRLQFIKIHNNSTTSINATKNIDITFRHVCKAHTECNDFTMSKINCGIKHPKTVAYWTSVPT